MSRQDDRPTQPAPAPCRAELQGASYVTLAVTCCPGSLVPSTLGAAVSELLGQPTSHEFIPISETPDELIIELRWALPTDESETK